MIRFFRALAAALTAAGSKLDLILKEQQHTMLAITDLTDAVTGLEKSIGALQSAISTSKLANGLTSDADIESTVGRLTSLKAVVDLETATLIGTAPVITPEPVPPVTPVTPLAPAA